MKRGNQYDEQAHCYEDLEGPNSNFGEGKGGRQYAESPRGGSGSEASPKRSTETVNPKAANRGKE